MRLSSVHLLLFLAMALSVSDSARADYGTIDLGYLGRPGPQMGNGGRFDYDVVNTSGLSMPSGWTLNLYDSPSTSAGGTDGIDDLFTFCMELSQFVPGDSVPRTYTVDPFAIGGALDKLGDYYWGLAILPGNNLQAGAFQLAVWEIVLGNGDLDINTSPQLSGSYTTDAKNLAQSWLNSLAALSDVPSLRMVALKNGSFQDQVTQISAVPEASAIIVWALITGVIGFVVYKRQQVEAITKAMPE